MKTLASLMLSALLTIACAAQTGSRTDVDKDLMKSVSEILRKCEAIKPGMTRGDLAKDFTVQGGVYSPWQPNYVYRRCPTIRIQIDFAKSDAPPSEFAERPTDIIQKVSAPYLAWGAGD